MNTQLGIDQVSLRNGYWFYFDDNGLKITAFGSSLSGKEVVFIEDDIVSERHSWRKNSSHRFKHNMDDYEVTYAVNNWSRGELACALKKNGILISTQTKAYIPDGEKTSSFLAFQFIVGLIVGAIFGFSAIYSFLYFRG